MHFCRMISKRWGYKIFESESSRGGKKEVRPRFLKKIGGSNLPNTTLYIKWIWDIKPADYGV